MKVRESEEYLLAKVTNASILHRETHHWALLIVLEDIFDHISLSEELSAVIHCD